MKKLSIIVFLTLLTLPFLSAKIITLDNNAGSVAMHSSVTAAYNAAEDGDTILVAGSTSAYGSLNCYKRLNWIGPGYWLAVNSIPGLSENSAQIRITFKKDGFFGDSSGSTITGMNAEIISDAGVTGVEVDKCSNEGPAYNWLFNGQVTITRSMNQSAQIQMLAANSSISNSIVTSLYLRAENITVDHCVVRNLIETRDTCTISNTIFYQLTAASGWDQVGNASYSYCVMIGADFLPNDGTNIKPPPDVFIQHVLLAAGSSNRDAYYQLTEASIAKGAGFGGADIGAYGGSNPYVLSGVPGIPRMTRYNAPLTATGLTAVTVEVEAEAFPE